MFKPIIVRECIFKNFPLFSIGPVHFRFKGWCVVFLSFIQILIEHSVRKQWRPDSAASGLDLHCLTMFHKKDARLLWVKKSFINRLT